MNEIIEIGEITEELRKLAAQKRVVIGVRSVKKALLNGNLERVFLTVNCSELLEREILHLSKLSNAYVIRTGLTSVRLGAVLKKPFGTLVAGVLKKEG